MIEEFFPSSVMALYPTSMSKGSASCVNLTSISPEDIQCLTSDIIIRH